MKILRRLFLRVFPRYYRSDVCLLTWAEADRLLRESADKAERYRWRIAPEEDTNTITGKVWLERRERITE